MSTIFLKNNTGKMAGRYIRYEFGEDLFGYLYLDVISGRKHRARKNRSFVFDDAREFIYVLDEELFRKECLHYVR